MTDFKASSMMINPKLSLTLSAVAGGAFEAPKKGKLQLRSGLAGRVNKSVVNNFLYLTISSI